MPDESAVVTVGVPDSTAEYAVMAVETIHRTYAVRASNPEQARQRLRRFFQDPEMVEVSIVRAEDEGERVRWQIRGEKRPKAKS